MHTLRVVERRRRVLPGADAPDKLSVEQVTLHSCTLRCVRRTHHALAQRCEPRRRRLHALG